MNVPALRIAAAAACVALLGAAAPEGWTPPAGWTVQSVTGAFGGVPIVLVWMGNRVDGISQNINVIHDATHSVAYQRGASEKILAHDAIGLRQGDLSCAGGPGYRYSYEAVFGARMLAVESSVVPDGAGGTYVATYVRPAAAQPDPEAESALQRICETRPDQIAKTS